MALTARRGSSRCSAPSWSCCTRCRLGAARGQRCLLLGVVADLVLAAPVRSLAFSRSGDTTARLGEPVTVTLAVVNSNRRALRGVLRDAWAPSAGAQPSRHRLDVPAGGRRLLSTELRPQRRGDQRPARVTVRSVGPLGLAARQGSHEVPWAVRVLPPFGSRRLIGEKLAQLRELDGRSAARSAERGPSSTRCASTSPATTSGPSTGGPPPAPPRSWCAPGGPSATGG